MARTKEPRTLSINKRFGDEMIEDKWLEAAANNSCTALPIQPIWLVTGNPWAILKLQASNALLSVPDEERKYRNGQGSQLTYPGDNHWFPQPPPPPRSLYPPDWR